MKRFRALAGSFLVLILFPTWNQTAGAASSEPANQVGSHTPLNRLESEIRREEERLRSIEARLARERDQEAKGKRRTRSILGYLDRLSARLAVEDQRLRLLDQKLKKSKLRQAEIRKKVQELRTSQTQRKHLLRQRLRALYMGGSAGNVRLLVMSESVWDMMDRWSVVTRMARHDERIISEYRLAEERLQRLDEEVSAEVKQQQELHKKQAETKRKVVAYYGRRTRELARLKKNKAKSARLMRELQGQRDSLRDAIISMIKAKDLQYEREAAQVDKMQGRLPWPVLGIPSAEKNGRRGSRGIRIFAPEGAPIRPVAPGEVVFSDWVRGYGRLLILRHGGDIYTVYGGAEEVFVDKGSKVVSKQVIARVGTTGALGDPALYFEIRRGSIPMEPLRWLSPRR